jgi:hypothetical protein
MMDILHSWGFVIGSMFLALLPRQTPGGLARRILRFAIFSLLLLLSGSLFSGIWSCTVWGRFYYSTDYVFDFWPFWPITQSIIDFKFGDERGKLIGCTLFQLNLIWLAFSMCAWAITITASWLLSRLLRPAKLSANTAGLIAGLLIFPTSLVAGGEAWMVSAQGTLIRSSAVGFSLSNLFPMLLQQWSKVSPGVRSVEFLKPPWLVYSVWSAFLACSVAIPSFIIWRMHRDAKKSIEPVIPPEPVAMS